jgi:hypothetical protein
MNTRTVFSWHPWHLLCQKQPQGVGHESLLGQHFPTGAGVPAWAGSGSSQGGDSLPLPGARELRMLLTQRVSFPPVTLNLNAGTLCDSTCSLLAHTQGWALPVDIPALELRLRAGGDKDRLMPSGDREGEQEAVRAGGGRSPRRGDTMKGRSRRKIGEALPVGQAIGDVGDCGGPQSFLFFFSFSFFFFYLFLLSLC